MATSSIFANFDIHDPEKAESFVRALELSERDKDSGLGKGECYCEYVTDHNRLREMFADKYEEHLDKSSFEAGEKT